MQSGSKEQGQKDALSAPRTWLRTEFLCPGLGPCWPALSLDLSTNARTSAAIIGRQCGPEEKSYFLTVYI